MKLLNLHSMPPALQISQIMNRIYRFGLTTTSGGNISILDEEGNIWITPSAIDKGTLRQTDIICVKSDGTVVGKHKPSSELPVHREIYQQRSDIRAIIHAHAPALVAFSIVHQILNTNLTPLVNQVCGKVGYAEYALPGSQDLAIRVAAALNNPYCKAVMMENHGIVVGGSDLEDAYCRFETLEFCAQTLINANHLGAPLFIQEKQLDLFFRSLSKPIYHFQTSGRSPKEAMLRQEICNIVARACNQKLMFGLCGTVSVRLGGNDFLITPANVARWHLTPDEIVLIMDGKAEMNKTPCQRLYLHQQIYQLHPNVNAVIMAQTPHLTAFAVAHRPLNVRTIPESWIFLQDLGTAPFTDLFDGEEAIAKKIGRAMPGVLIENDFFIITGETLLQAFDRLEVAEFSAKSIILSKHLGEMIPINDRQVEQLRKTFQL